MPVPTRLNTAAKLRLEQIAGKAARYMAINEQVKPLESEKKKLSSDLKEAAQTIGTKDEKGSSHLEVGDFVVSSVVSKKNIIDHAKAVEVLTRLNLLERCTVTVVDEKALEIAFQEGLITMDDIDYFTTVEDGTPRVDVKRK